MEPSIDPIFQSPNGRADRYHSARIEAIGRQLKGPMPNVERILLCGDRAAYRKALAALDATGCWSQARPLQTVTLGSYASVTGATTDDDIEKVALDAAYAHFEQELSDREKILVSVAVDHAMNAFRARTLARIEATI